MTKKDSSIEQKNDEDDQLDGLSTPKRRDSKAETTSGTKTTATSTTSATSNKSPPSTKASGAVKKETNDKPSDHIEPNLNTSQQIRGKGAKNNSTRKDDTMQSVKQQERKLRLAEAVADPEMRAQEETSEDIVKSMKETKKSEGQLRHASVIPPDVESMKKENKSEGPLRHAAVVPPEGETMNEATELRYASVNPPDVVQGQQAENAVMYPGAVHVNHRLSNHPMNDSIRQSMEEIQGMRIDPPQEANEDPDPEACVSAHLVPQSKDKRDHSLVVAEHVQKKCTVCGMSRRVLIVSVLFILIVGNVTLGIVFSGKKPEESPDPSPTVSPSAKSVSNLDPILQTVKDRGFIRCKPEALEFSQGKGFTLDLCRAIAAAIFDDVIDGNTDRTQLIDMPFKEQFAAIWDGTIDVSTSLTTRNMVRDVYEPSTGLGIAFSTPFFYDGMRFAGIPTFVDCAERGDSLNGECRGLSVCVLAGSTHAENILNILGGAQIHEGAENTVLYEMFVNSTCNIITSEVFFLKEHLVQDIGYEGEYSIGSKLLSNEPLAITSKGDDEEWADFCNWILQALITAEDLDITQETALSSQLWSEATTGTNFPEISSVFGDEYKNMFRNAIAAVGNYGELYDQYYEAFAPRSTGIANTVNFGESGLLYSFPFGNLIIDESGLLPNVAPPGPTINGTLESIESRGILRCGITGFAFLEDTKDNVETRIWTGLDIEYCRAIAAAIFPQSLSEDVDLDSVIEFIDVQDGYVALDDDTIDVFVGGNITLSTDVKEAMTGKGFTFTPPYFYYDINDTMSNYDMGDNIGRSLVTREIDPQWSAFVRWIIISIIYAEQNNIEQENAFDMPVVELFGLNYLQMFRDTILAVGNYGEIFNRTLSFPHNISRSGRNWINVNGEPQFVNMPFV